MTQILKRISPQTLAGIGALAAGLLLLGISRSGEGSTAVSPTNGPQLLLALCLVVALILSHQFPIRIREHTRMYMGAVPLYLMSTLLPPPQAAVAAALGTCAGLLATRAQRDLHLGHVATETGRWIVLTWVGAWSLQLMEWAGLARAQALLATVVVLWLGSAATCPLFLSLLRKESPPRAGATYLREVGLAEAAQYLLGLLGALVAVQQFWALALLLLPIGLVYLAIKSARDVDLGGRQVLESMADTVDLRDPWMRGHSKRVAEYAALILQQLRRSGSEAEMIVAAARIHDIGNIGIPDQLLCKPGRLTPEEHALVETHAERGAELLRRYPDFLAGAEMVRHHHERWDGTGYPARLQALDIPFGARVIAVADSFDAMTSERPYRNGLTATEAAVILREGRGSQWDAAVVDAFLRAIGADILDASPHLRVVSNGPGATATA